MDKKYKQIKILEEIKLGKCNKKEADRVENEITLKYMKVYGWDKVRGGDYCSISQYETYKHLIRYVKFFDIKPPKNKDLYYIFTLLLEEGYYFIGWTTNLRSALNRYKNGKPSKWVNTHKPIKLVDLYCLPESHPQTILNYVDKIVLETMKNNNYAKVRGGRFLDLEAEKHKEFVLRYIKTRSFKELEKLDILAYKLKDKEIENILKEFGIDL